MAIQVNIQERKLELIQWLSTVDDVSVINKIADLRTEENQEHQKGISDAEKNSITSGLNDADAGKLNPHSKARLLYEKWL